MPRPILIDFDRGLDAIGVDSIPAPATWPESMALITGVVNAPGDYRSLVLDTADPLEEQAVTEVLRSYNKKGLADVPKGDGWIAVGNLWRELLSILELGRKNGLSVCLLAHSSVRQAQDPTLGEYDVFAPQLQKKSWAATNRWADLIGFACFDQAKVGDERRTILTGERILHTVKGSGFEAKNRWGMPPSLPLDWPIIEAAMRPQAGVLEAREAITELAAGTGLEAKAAEYIQSAGGDIGKLYQILEALRAKVKS